MKLYGIMSLLLLLVTPLSAQRIINVKEGYVLIDSDKGIGKVGDRVVVQRKTQHGTVNVGFVEIIKFQDGKAGGEILKELESYKVQPGDSVYNYLGTSENEPGNVLIIPLMQEYDSTYVTNHPQKADSTKPIQTDFGPLVSNVFYEMDLREALQDLSLESKINIVADNTVQGYVTIEIENLPLEKALERILSVGGFSFKKMQDYYIVGLAHPSNPTFYLLSMTETIPINYIPSDVAINLLSDYYKPFVKLNKLQNSISVTASPAMVKKIVEDIRKVDIPSRQVTIEAVVMEVKRNDLKSIGIDWSLFGEKNGKSLGVESKNSYGLLDTLGSIFRINPTGIPVGLMGFSMKAAASLQALVQDGKAEIKANPKVITVNAQPAIIYIAKEQFFSVITGPVNYPYARIEKVSVGIKLEITPFISETNEITVKIVPEVSDAIGYGREGLPLIDSRMVSTNVRVKNGQTIILGGLTQESVREVQNKIPILGHIPILGYLFSHTKYEKQTTEIVIFITPEIKQEM